MDEITRGTHQSNPSPRHINSEQVKIYRIKCDIFKIGRRWRSWGPNLKSLVVIRAAIWPNYTAPPGFEDITTCLHGPGSGNKSAAVQVEEMSKAAILNCDHDCHLAMLCRSMGKQLGFKPVSIVAGASSLLFEQ